MATGAVRMEGVVTVDGIEFERKNTRGVTFTAPDGVRLRSPEDVEKYLVKCGLSSTLPHSLALFNFDLCVANEDACAKNGNASTLRVSRGGVLSAQDTPVKPAQQGTGGSGRGSPSGKTAEAGSTGLECEKDTVENSESTPAQGDSARGRKRTAPSGSSAASSVEEVEPEGKRRNRAIAQSRAAAFAMGRGFVDDAGRESKRPAGGAASKRGKKGKEKEDDFGDVGEGDENETPRESWPGPWSTANALYTKRDAAVEARKGAGAGVQKHTVLWKPATDAKKRHGGAPLRAIPSLQHMCIDMVATHIDACLEHGLGAILPEMKAKICENLCRNRRLLPNVLPIFTDGETTVLSLPDCSYIGEQDMVNAFQRCQGPALEVLNLKYCGRSLSDKLLEDLCCHSPNLHTLQLGGCYRVSDKGIASAVKALPQLRVLELSDCRNISVEALKSVAAVGDTLESLSLKNSTQLDSEALLQLARLKNLKRLSLSGCRGASDVIVEVIVEACGVCLEQLDISHLPDSGFSAEPVLCRISDVALELIAAKCTSLQQLRLQNCDTITDRGLLALSEGVCVQLSHVDFTRCKGLTDEGLVALVSKCKMLSHLSLNAAGLDEFDEDSGTQTHGITNRTLIALREHASKRLEELDVSWCRGVTDDGLGHLIDHAHQLKTLHLRGCGQISDIFLDGHSNETVPT